MDLVAVQWSLCAYCERDKIRLFSQFMQHIKRYTHRTHARNDVLLSDKVVSNHQRSCTIYVPTHTSQLAQVAFRTMTAFIERNVLIDFLPSPNNIMWQNIQRCRIRCATLECSRIFLQKHYENDCFERTPTFGPISKNVLISDELGHIEFFLIHWQPLSVIRSRRFVNTFFAFSSIASVDNGIIIYTSTKRNDTWDVDNSV